MSDVIKFTDEEMQEIASLQAKYQQKILELGQVQLAKIDLEQAEKNLSERKEKVLGDWKEIQKEEETLMGKLASKYGNGSLNLKDGTFKPAPPATTT
jgi:DNA repair exonuclease SbcCD ATPase subunit